MPGEFRALPLLRLATAAMQSDAMSHHDVSDPQRTVGHVWGGRPTLDSGRLRQSWPCPECRQHFLVVKSGFIDGFDQFESAKYI
jgi:hypothetical protein